MSGHNLHDLVLSYQSEIGSQKPDKESIFSRIASIVYASHTAFGFDDEDAASDALLKYRKRIIHLVDRFQDRGLPFDVYLAASLRFLAKTVRRERRRETERRLICEQSAMEDYTLSWAREYHGDVKEHDASSRVMEPGLCDPLLLASPSSHKTKSGGKGTASKRRPRARGGLLPGRDMKSVRSTRLIFLTVKCAWELDDESVERIADSVGVSRDWLSQAVAQARRSLEPERIRYDQIAERRNASWCRCRLLESKLEQENDPLVRVRLKSSLEREDRRFKKACEELGALKPVVPNAVVARILGVPKGTVDSGLYYLRKQQQRGCLRKKKPSNQYRSAGLCSSP